MTCRCLGVGWDDMDARHRRVADPEKHPRRAGRSAITYNAMSTLAFDIFTVLELLIIQALWMR